MSVQQPRLTVGAAACRNARVLLVLLLVMMMLPTMMMTIRVHSPPSALIVGYCRYHHHDHLGATLPCKYSHATHT